MQFLRRRCGTASGCEALQALVSRELYHLSPQYSGATSRRVSSCRICSSAAGVHDCDWLAEEGRGSTGPRRPAAVPPAPHVWSGGARVQGEGVRVIKVGCRVAALWQGTRSSGSGVCPRPSRRVICFETAGSWQQAGEIPWLCPPWRRRPGPSRTFHLRSWSSWQTWHEGEGRALGQRTCSAVMCEVPGAPPDCHPWLWQVGPGPPGILPLLT